MKIIDAHSHFNTGSAFDSPTSEIYHCDVKSVLKEAAVAGIGAGFYSSMPGVCSRENVPAENDFVYKVCLNNESAYMWTIINPLDERTFEQAEEYLKYEKCVGIKIHPVYHKYSMRNYGERIISFAAEHNAVVLAHPSDSNMIADLMLKYPKTTLIYAHLGGKTHVDVMKAAPNIMTDTSGGASINNEVLEYAVREVGYERILFGTDTYSCAAQRGRVEYANIPDKAKEAIFYGNAERLFGV